MSERLQEQVAIITGASRGIGRVMAHTFAREGAAVVVAAKSTEERPGLPGTIHSVAAEIEAAGGTAMPFKVDVRDTLSIQALTDAVMERFGRIDILVNNAGALWWQDVLDTPMKRFDLIMGVNARGAFACSQAVLPHMVAGGRGGHILMCSPPIILHAIGGKTAYLISKYGMTLTAMGIAEEMRDHRIAANALWPVTLVESQATINHKLGEPKHWRKAEILADAALEIVASAPDQLTGQALLDEDFLRTQGWTDFTRYRCDPDHEPMRIMPENMPKAGPVPG